VEAGKTDDGGVGDDEGVPDGRAAIPAASNTSTACWKPILRIAIHRSIAPRRFVRQLKNLNLPFAAKLKLPRIFFTHTVQGPDHSVPPGEFSVGSCLRRKVACLNPVMLLFVPVPPPPAKDFQFISFGWGSRQEVVTGDFMAEEQLLAVDAALHGCGAPRPNQYCLECLGRAAGGHTLR